MNIDSGLSQNVLYNPRQLRAETLKAVFGARLPLLKRLLDDLRPTRPSHKLIVGTRGMGKTTLLRRLGLGIEEDDDLNRRWLPLTFPEEQYNVGSLGEFYLNCLDALGDYLEKHGSPAGTIDTLVRDLRRLDRSELARAGEEALLQQAAQRGKNFVLLVDNLSILFDRLDNQEKWQLREFLSRADGPVLVAAATQFIADVGDHGAAFYEFLHVHELTGCDTDEADAVLRQLAETFQKPHVTQWLDADPARLATLNRLAGGTPRTLVMLFQLLVQGPEGAIMDELERLLDLATPLYKARLEDLPDQAQRVVDALALQWDPATRRDLERILSMEGNAISSQLSRLAKLGVVEQVDLPHENKAGYQIAERFFNIWYLMRASRRARHQLRWLVEFLRAFYSATERVRLARDAVDGRTSRPSDPIRGAQRLLAYSQAIDDAFLRERLEHAAFYMLARTKESLSHCLDLSDVDRKRLEKLKEVADHENSILDEIQQQPSADRYHRLGWLHQFRSKDYVQAEAAYLKALQLDPEHAPSWRGLGMLWGKSPDRLGKAESAFRRALELEPGDPATWTCLGELYASQQALSDKAREAYEKAVSLELDDGYPWLSFGRFLMNQPNRFQEAESALRQAAKLTPREPFAWWQLGALYMDARKYSAAEEAHRLAVELDPTDMLYNLSLAYVQHLLGRTQQAEQGYRDAIRCDANTARPKVFLACLLFELNKELIEAERLAREALAIQPDLGAVYILASILARRGNWLEGRELIRRHFQQSPEKLVANQHDALKLYCRELVWQGRAMAAHELLQELDLTERWRPVAEALKAAAAGDRELLKRLNPEQREPAEKIFDFFMEAPPAQPKKERRPQPKRKKGRGSSLRAKSKN